MKILFKLSVLSLVVGSIRAQLPNFQASYRGDFQVFLGEGCTTESPVLRAACRGAISITSIQHASVVCGSSQFDSVTGFNFIECTNTCIGVACEAVYLGGNDSNIDFECSGNDVLDVEAYFTFVSGNGSCTAGTEDSRSNFHIAQLGVRCGGPTTYDFDERYFECNSDSIGVGADNGALSCFGGDTCDTGPCTVEYDDFTVLGNLPRYLESNCVVANNGAQKVLPPSTLSLLVVNAVFEASWARFQEDDTQQNCSGGNPTILIKCTNGEIRFVGGSPGAVACTGVDMSTIECTNAGPSPSIDGQTNSVEYSCTGLSGNNAYPETAVTFPPEEAFCDGNTVLVTVQHALQLGVECSRRFEYDLMYTECTDREQRFERYDEFGEIGSRYTCVSETSFGRNSGASFVREVAEVGIETDLIWGTDAPTNCWDNGVGPGTQLFTVVPTTAPTQAPVSPPSSQPVVVTPTVTNDDGSSAMPAIIGGAVGGVAILSLAVVFVVYIKKRNAEDSKDAPAPSHAGSGGTGFENSYDEPGPAPYGQQVPPHYHPNQRPANYPPSYQDDSPTSPKSARHNADYGRPNEDYGHVGAGYAGAPPGPRSSNNYSPYDRNTRGYDYPDSDSQPSHSSPRQQRTSRYAGPPSRGSSRSNRSSGTRGLTNKDQCMSVVSVIEGVPVQNKEPPLVNAKMVGETYGDGRMQDNDDGRSSRSGGRSRRSYDP